MRTTLDGVDIVYIGIDILVVGRVVGHGYLDGYPLTLGRDVYHVVDQVLLVGVNVADKLHQTVFREEDVFAGLAVLVLHPKVGERERDAGIQEGQVAQPMGQNIVVVNGRREDRGIGVEDDGRTRLVGFAYYFDAVQRFSIGKLLHVHLAVATNLGTQIGRQGIHTRHTYTVQTARHFVRAFIKFTTGVQHRKYHFESRLVLLLVHVDRDTPTVVDNLYRVVFVDIYLDVSGITGHGLVD